MLFLSINRLDATKHIQYENIGIELRLDLFPAIDLQAIQPLLHDPTRPVLLTLRKPSHGGQFRGSESEREALIEQLLTLHPPFFDLEYDMRPAFLHAVMRRYTQTQFILSCHHFTETPLPLEAIYRNMQNHTAFAYKIASVTRSASDALRLLLFAKSHPNVSAICMGDQGSFARVLGPIVGNPIDYASVSVTEQTGPGQLTIADWMEIYHYPLLSTQTAVYALIGDPVEKSQGHLYHNAVFRQRHINAVYVKIPLGPEELPEFIPLAQQLGFKGLSVTMPLKEAILPFAHAICPKAESIRALNTLRLHSGRIEGTNTDGPGALDAIERKMPVNGKRVVLLGAGGAARAIAWEAKARGARVLILNRTVERAEQLAAEFGCEAGALNQMPAQYDVLIHCTSDCMPINPQYIHPGVVVMDLTYVPRETAFLQAAALKNCQIVYGDEMFYNQAARQTAFWVGGCSSD